MNGGLGMTGNKTLSFTIPGAIASDHRPKVSQFRKGKDGQQIRRDKPLTYMLKDYEDFKDRVHLYANVARRDARWVAPDKGTKIKMYLHFYVAEKKWTHGKKMKPYLATRNVPDHGNMSKCVEDSLQDKFDKQRNLKWEGLYHDDADVITLPFPGKESWVTIVPGTNEWIDVQLVLMDEPPGTQLGLDVNTKRGGASCAGIGDGVDRTPANTETFNHQNQMTAPTLSFAALSSSGAVILETTIGVCR